VTENLNPYQPPQETSPLNKSGRLTVVDFVVAILLGCLALVVTLIATGIGILMSLMAARFDYFPPIMLWLCLLFSIGVGVSATANYLVKKSQSAAGDLPQTQSFQVDRSAKPRTKATKLDELIFSFGIGFMALMVLVPIISFLLNQLSDAWRVDSNTNELLSYVAAGGICPLVSWWYWRRVSRTH